MKKLLLFVLPFLLALLCACEKPAVTPQDEPQETQQYNIDSPIEITASGVYRITGSNTESRITVNVDKEADDKTVQLILDGVDLYSEAHCPIEILEAQKVEIVLPEGTQSRVTLSPNSQDIKAAIYSKADLEITGSGSLEVFAENSDGINSRDDLVISGGNITVTCGADAVVGKDELRLTGGSLKIDCAKDGLKSTNTDDSQKGNIAITGGEIEINALDDCIQAVSLIEISGGSLKLCAEDPDKAPETPSFQDDGSTCKGISCDGDVVISGGEIEITHSGEGIQGTNVTLTGGHISVNSDDDGINASQYGGVFQMDGGEVEIYAGGDGIDSNGSLIFNGGSVKIDVDKVGPMDTPVDYENEIQQNGGSLTDMQGGEIDTSNFPMRGGRPMMRGEGDMNHGAKTLYGGGRAQPKHPIEEIP